MHVAKRVNEMVVRLMVCTAISKTLNDLSLKLNPFNQNRYIIEKK